MIDYRNYVDPTKEISLAEFKNRENLATKAIGYGKSAMIFHMLRKTIGDEAFFAGLRKLVADHTYHQVSWEQIKECFIREREKSKVGEHFFEQWMERKGVPSLTVTDPQVVFRDGSYLLSFHVVQREENFKMDIPARVLTDDGEERFVIKVDQADVRFEKQLTGRPLVLIIDEDYDIMRRLAEAEVPPVISAFTGSKENIVVVPEQYAQTYADVVKFFRHQGFEVKDHVSDKDIKEKSILLLATESNLYRRFFADAPLPDTGFAVKVHRNPLNPTKVVVVFHGKDGGELRAAYRKIFHYGNYSFLHFQQGNSIAKETEKTENGIVVSLGTSVEALETRNALDLDEVVGKIKDQGIIYIGENHNEYAHHVMQCEIIRRLAREGKRLVIGMEMFQRPFQRYIDQYIRGEISEEAFLKKTEYFKRWGFDYNLYRDILHLARAKQLPVVALNIRKEIVEKVAKQGINSLSKAEFAEVPEDMDMTNQNYRTFLQGAFAQHAETEAKDFDNFFESQIIWDESMAHTVVQAMKEYPGSQVIVLAGNGHLQNSWGIPDRVMRQTGQRGFVILNGGEEGIDKKLADFVLFPGQMKAPDSPKLLVELVEKEGGVTVKEVMKGGSAERAGIKEGDIIKKVGDKEITEIADVKIALLSKRKGDHEKVMILRTALIPPGSKALEIEVLF